jgi:large subunit ribosomal protein L23
MKLVSSEKAMKMIEVDNILVFATNRQVKRNELKKEIEELFDVKIDSINTLIKKNKKYAYVKLNKSNPAIDVATKLGMI